MSKMVKCIVIILVIGLVASVVMNVMQALHYKNDAPAAQEKVVENPQKDIIELALKDLDLKLDLTNNCSLAKIYGDKETETYLMTIKDNGLYIVGVNYVDGKVHYVDVENKIL